MKKLGGMSTCQVVLIFGANR